LKITSAWLGVIRGLGMVIALPLLTYLGDAAHLSSVASPIVASVIAIIALSLEHTIESETGKALFGVATISNP
jgi:hypothetical protein